MNTLLRTIALVGIVVLVSLPAEAVNVKVVGGMTSTEPERAPSGLCAGSFTMTSAGVLNYTESSSITFFDTAPLENSYEGFGYHLINNPTESINNLYKINLTALTVAGVTVTDTANNPDPGNSQQASHYNTFTKKWVQTARTQSPLYGTDFTCNLGGALNCLHIRTYSTGTISGDVLPAIGTQVDSGVVRYTFDSTHTYISYVQGGGTPGTFLGKFLTASSYTFVTSVLTDAAVQFVGITNDTNYIYATFAPNVIRRYLKTNIGAGPTSFTPGIANINDIIYDSGTNKLYVVSSGGGINTIYRVNASTMAIDGTLSLGASEFPSNVLIDQVNNKLYIAIRGNGLVGNLNRVNRTTFLQEAAFGTISTANGPAKFTIDVPHQKAYIAFQGGGGDVVKLQKVNLCS